MITFPEGYSLQVLPSLFFVSFDDEVPSTSHFLVLDNTDELDPMTQTTSLLLGHPPVVLQH